MPPSLFPPNPSRRFSSSAVSEDADAAAGWRQHPHPESKRFRRHATRDNTYLGREDSESDEAASRAAKRGGQKTLKMKEGLRDGESFVALMREQGWKLLAKATPELRADRGVVLEAMRLSSGTALEVAAPALRRDAELICEALQLQASNSLWMDSTLARPAWEKIIERFMPKVPKPPPGRKESSPSSPAERRPRYTRYARSSFESSMVEDSGQPIRVKPIVGLRLHRSDGLLLVQLAKSEAISGELVNECVLPGRSISAEKWPRDEMGQFVEDMLAPLARAIHLGREAKFTLEERISRTKHVSTRYLRAVFDGTLEAGFHWERYFSEVPVAPDRLLQHGAIYRRRAPSHSSGLVQRLNAGKGNSHLAPVMYAMLPEHLDHPDARLAIYAWLPGWEYDWLHEPLGKAALDGWMADLDQERLRALLREALPMGRLSPRSGILAAVRELRLEPRASARKAAAGEASQQEGTTAALSARSGAEESRGSVRRALDRFKALRAAALARQEGEELEEG